MRVANLLKTKEIWALVLAKKYKGTSGGSHQFSLTHYSEIDADQGIC